MGFGIGDIVSGAKNAVSSAVNTVSHAAEAVGGEVKKAEEAISNTVKSAIDALGGHSGFDDDGKPGLGPLAESKPKGSGGSSSSLA
jgi:hypothetical protein